MGRRIASMDGRIGILDIGIYLPPEVRRNDWWPADTVARWTERARSAQPATPGPLSASGARIMSAVAALADDPFQGAVERRVMAADMSSSDMEASAARDALERAGIDPGEIDLLLVHSVAPDHQLGNVAAALHHRLGLPRRCLAMQADASSYAFLGQLALAEAMIAAGRAGHALLVQSCAASRLLEADDAIAPYFGDGASAVVVGPVATRGLRGSVHFADGRYPSTVIASVPGGTWFDEGRAVIHVADPAGLRAVFVQTADLCKESVEAALASSRISPSDVRFFCAHQGTKWLSGIAQEHAGLRDAASIDTFARTGYVFSASIPLSLRMAVDEGRLAPTDVVVLFAGGTGMTYGATVLEWGR
jgi:3-oxoacyl-[acyl-carrier-protein] synthase-3